METRQPSSNQWTSAAGPSSTSPATARGPWSTPWSARARPLRLLAQHERLDRSSARQRALTHRHRLQRRPRRHVAICRGFLRRRRLRCAAPTHQCRTQHCEGARGSRSSCIRPTLVRPPAPSPTRPTATTCATWDSRPTSRMPATSTPIRRSSPWPPIDQDGPSFSESQLCRIEFNSASLGCRPP